jgi:hypothetical protein
MRIMGYSRPQLSLSECARCTTHSIDSPYTFDIFETMLQSLNEGIAVTFRNRAWLAQLGGILPLSALIDFLDVPRAFHLFQLKHQIPLWCWPITPAGSRILLARHGATESCWLDCVENSATPTCLDGRYGDQYPMANSRTLGMCLESYPTVSITNGHRNMTTEAGRRPQTLEVVVMKQIPPEIIVSRCLWKDFAANRRQIAGANSAENGIGARGELLDCTTSWRCTVFCRSAGLLSMARRNWLHRSTVGVGWALWVFLVVASTALQSYLSLAFLVAILLSGLSNIAIHGNKPRRQATRDTGGHVSDMGGHNRIVLTAEHVNATHWRAYYGVSTVVNPLLNWPLLPGEFKDKRRHVLLRHLLRASIYMQWTTAVGAAAQQGLAAYLIALWIFFCIICINHTFCSDLAARDWLEGSAEVRLQRYTACLSSRRALLNTVMCLNPDTQPAQSASAPNQPGQTTLEGIGWMDPILKTGAARDLWLHASCRAMYPGSVAGNSPAQLEQEFADQYWWPFIQEGIQVADNIRRCGKF